MMIMCLMSLDSDFMKESDFNDSYRRDFTREVGTIYNRAYEPELLLSTNRCTKILEFIINLDNFKKGRIFSSN